MKIEFLPASRVAELTDTYNDHVSDVPFCDPVPSERFLDSGCWRDADSAHQVGGQVYFVAEGEDRFLGYAHVAAGRFPGPELYGDDSGGETGVIRFLTSPAGRRDAGQALLTAVEAHLADSGVGRILAFPNNGYVFQRFAFGELSERCGHLLALFRMNDYRIARGEVFMRWPNFQTAEHHVVDPDAEVVVCDDPDPQHRPTISITVEHDGDLVGVIEGRSLAKWGASAESEETVALGPMDVEEQFQGRGWGRFLLRAMLKEARKLGYRHTVTSTQQHNHRAQLLYTNEGYIVTDTAYSLLKEL